MSVARDTTAAISEPSSRDVDLKARIGRQIEQLSQPHEGEVTVGSPLDHERLLRVTRHLRPQLLELGLVADLAAEPDLAQRRLRLVHGRLRDEIQLIRQRGVVVGARDIEHQLRPRRGQAHVRDSPARTGNLRLRANATRRKNRLADRQVHVPRVSHGRTAGC